VCNLLKQLFLNRFSAWLVLSLLVSGNVTAFGVNWEQQSERLLQISGSILEGVPMGDPAISKYRLGLYADVSLLPKLNPTIGSKTEKVPSSPVHAVPSLLAGAAFDIASKWKLTSALKAGYLMPGVVGRRQGKTFPVDRGW
jgi:hypothetical protein